MAHHRLSDEVSVISKTNWYAIVAGLLIVVFVAGLATVSSMKAPVSEIRIRNATDRDLENVVVGRGHYGQIGRGEVSGYESWGRHIDTRACRWLRMEGRCSCSQ